MVWHIAASGLILHVYCWGAALAVLLLPRRLERLWLLIAPLAGLALQTGVVYIAGLFPALEGTDAYGRLALALPAGLALLVWRLRGRRGAIELLRSGARAWPVLLVQAAIVAALVQPMAGSGLPLTSLSFGSCDAADYGAGARLFQEFSSSDRTGFLGQTEVVKVGESTDFRGFWLRLNHFTPVAGMALFGSVAGLRFFETVTLFTAALPALIVPLALLFFRRVLRFNAFGAGAGAAAVGTSPLLAYAVYQVAPAQLLATLAVTGLTWAAVRAFEVARGWRGLWSWTGVTVAAFVLLLGSYNFFVIAAPAPAVAWVLWRAWRRRRPGSAIRWSLWLCGCGAVAGAILPARVAGIVERFRLFGAYDFGWPMAGLRPDGWLGAVNAPRLLPASGGLLAAGCALLLATVVIWVFQFRRRDPGLFAAVALAAPPILGYGILLREAATQGNNASYDAYKLLCVFLPMVVGALAPWLRAPRRSVPAARAGTVVLGTMLALVNFVSTRGFEPVGRHPPFFVDEALASVEAIERLPEVDAINMRIDGFWPRLWANAFLLRKAQYFETHTYEGRRPTALLADFDLRAAFFEQHGPEGPGPLWQSEPYLLVDRRANARLDVAFGAGWFDFERWRDETWRWSRERPEIRIASPDGARARVAMEFDVSAVEDRDLFIEVDGREIWRGHVGPSRSHVDVPAFLIGSGGSALVFGSSRPPTPAPPGDPRALLIAVHGCVIDWDEPKDSSPGQLDDRGRVSVSH